jgi:sugar phosphate isomerase/epimerase
MPGEVGFHKEKESAMFKLAVFTDEITQDLDLAIQVAKEYQCEGVEIRSVWDTPIHKLSDAQVAEIKAKLGDAGLAVCCLGTPFYKCEIDKPEEIKEHHEILRRCCAVAKELGTGLVRGFTFWRRGPVEPVWQQIIDNFEIPTKILEEMDTTMVVENEASTYVGTGGMTASFLDEVAHPKLAAVWDPCNVLFDFDVEEVPFPDGYRALRKHIIHVHLKDGERTGPNHARCTRIGEGDIDYPGQFRALLQDGYNGWVSLETHWRPVDLTEEEMNRPGGANYSKEGEYATRRCLESIHEMIAAAKKEVSA